MLKVRWPGGSNSPPKCDGHIALKSSFSPSTNKSCILSKWAQNISFVTLSFAQSTLAQKPNAAYCIDRWHQLIFQVATTPTGWLKEQACIPAGNSACHQIYRSLQIASKTSWQTTFVLHNASILQCATAQQSNKRSAQVRQNPCMAAAICQIKRQCYFSTTVQ